MRKLADCDKLKSELRDAIKAWATCASSNLMKLVGVAIIGLIALFN